MRWTEYVVTDDETLTNMPDMPQGGTFVIAEGASWVVGWSDDGDEFWTRPIAEGDGAFWTGGVQMLAEYAAYPFTYVFEELPTP